MTRSVLPTSSTHALRAPAGAGLEHRLGSRRQRREVLQEPGDALDGAGAQFGPVGVAEAGDEVALEARLVGEPGERFVDEHLGDGLALPVGAELDRLVRHEPAGVGRRPLERVGQEVLGLAAEHLGEEVLAHHQPLAFEPPAAPRRRPLRPGRRGRR